MRIVAWLLLCSCSPVAISAPSSIPYVHIDPELNGVVVSRDAAIAIVTKRLDYEAKCAVKQADCEVMIDIAREEARSAMALADKASWWSSYGTVLLTVVVLVSLGGGFAFGYVAANAVSK